MDPNEKNRTFKETPIGPSDGDGALTPLDPKIDNAADARRSRETKIHLIHVSPDPNTAEPLQADIENEIEENNKDTESVEEDLDNELESESMEEDEREEMGDESEENNHLGNRSQLNVNDKDLPYRSESDSEEIQKGTEIANEEKDTSQSGSRTQLSVNDEEDDSSQRADSDSEEVKNGTEVGEDNSSQRANSASDEVKNLTEIGEEAFHDVVGSESVEENEATEIGNDTFRSTSQVIIPESNSQRENPVGLRPLLRDAHEINTNLTMVVENKEPNNIIWLIGSDENPTFNSPYGRCLIEKIFEIVIDSDSLLMVHGTNKFHEEVKNLYQHSKLMSETQHILAYVSEDLFIKTEFPNLDNEEKPIFQCAFVFEVHDHQYTRIVENCVNAIPVIIIQDFKEDTRNGADSNGGSILTTRLSENNPPTIPSDPVTHTRIYWDLKQSIETKNIDHSGVVDKIITAFKTHYKLTEQITEPFRSQWIFLCISLNYNDTELEQHIKERIRSPGSRDLSKTFEREAMLSISLHRQQFLTILCKNGLDIRKLLNDEFMLKLYTKAKWKRYIEDEKKKGILVKSYESNHEEDCQMERIKSNLKSMLKLRIGSILFGTEIKDEHEHSELLFITSVLESKLELSIVFWTYVRHPVAAALIAYGVFKSMKTSGNKYENMLEENMITYRKLSIEATFKGFFRDMMKTFELLLQEIPEWGNLSCIDIALDTRNEKFLSKTPTILLRSHIWSGEPKKNSTSNDESMSKKPCHCCHRCHFTPWSIWILSLISNITLFVLYSFLLVTTLEASSFHWLEWIMLLRVVMFPIMIILGRRRFLRRIDNIFNVLKIISLVLFVTAWIFRVAAYFKMDTPELMQVARVLYSATLMVWAVDFLKYFYHFENLGPFVEMIFQMMSTLRTFIIVILVFIVGYSVASESVLYPNAAVNIKLPFYLFRKSFWSIFGQLFLEELEAADGSCTNDPELYNDYSTTRCPSEEGRYWVPMMLGAYVVVVNIMLINLLIAKFNSIIVYIEIKARQIWHYQNFQIAMEYREVHRCISCNHVASQSKYSGISDEKTKEVTFEQKVVEYLKQQIDDGRFFKRLEAYKKTKAKSLHGVFSSLKDITESLSTHGQILETFQTDVIESLKERHVVFDDFQKVFEDKTVGVINDVKRSNNGAATNLIDIITDKLQKEREHTAQEINRGYEKMFELEKKVRRGKEIRKKIRVDLEQRKRAARRRYAAMNTINVRGERNRSELEKQKTRLTFLKGALKNILDSMQNNNEHLKKIEDTASSVKELFDKKLDAIENKTTDMNAAIEEMQKTIKVSTQEAQSYAAAISKLEAEVAASQPTLTEINARTLDLIKTYPKFTKAAEQN